MEVILPNNLVVLARKNHFLDKHANMLSRIRRLPSRSMVDVMVGTWYGPSAERQAMALYSLRYIRLSLPTYASRLGSQDTGTGNAIHW